jgi:hypothetical protein
MSAQGPLTGAILGVLAVGALLQHARRTRGVRDLQQVSERGELLASALGRDPLAPGETRRESEDGGEHQCVESDVCPKGSRSELVHTHQCFDEADTANGRDGVVVCDVGQREARSDHRLGARRWRRRTIPVLHLDSCARHHARRERNAHRGGSDRRKSTKPHPPVAPRSRRLAVARARFGTSLELVTAA